MTKGGFITSPTSNYIPKKYPLGLRTSIDRFLDLGLLPVSYPIPGILGYELHNLPNCPTGSPVVEI